MKFICVLIAIGKLDSAKRNISVLLLFLNYIFWVIAFIAVVNASGPKIQNLCDRIKCDEADNVQVCGQNGQGQYKVFENSCEMKKYNCNRNQSKEVRFLRNTNEILMKFHLGFAPVDTDVCRIVYELGGGFFFQP